MVESFAVFSDIISIIQHLKKKIQILVKYIKKKSESKKKVK